MIKTQDTQTKPKVNLRKAIAENNAATDRALRELEVNGVKAVRTLSKLFCKSKNSCLD